MVLFDRVPSIDEVAQSIAQLQPRQRELGQDKQKWMNGNTDLLVAFRPEVKGELAIDVLDEPWPDTMGDPENAADLFAAWSMGSFGPLVYPGNLERAAQQSVSLDDAPALVGKHKGFVRLRTTYVIGAGEDAKIVPQDHDPLEEAMLLITAARLMLELPGAIAYFDPNGEIIATREEMDASVTHAEGAKVPPLDLFNHVRFFRVDEQWSIMDTVGMDRFFLPDLEIVFSRELDPNNAAGFLRTLCLYMLQRGPVLKDGDTIDGPQGKLRVKLAKESLAEPPRPVARLMPEGAKLPEGLDS
jgi:hypothetical protein